MLPNKFTALKIILLATLLLLTGFGCKPNQEVGEVETIELNYWQVWQNSFDLTALIEKYEAQYPNVKIYFRRLRFEEYEEEMLRSLAEDKGPDIFSIPHNWVGLYKNILAPQPAEVEIQRIITKAPGPGELKPTIQKIYTERVALLRPRDIKRNYYPFVAEDVLEERKEQDSSAGIDSSTRLSDKEQIVALPLNIDTLALYYNKDILEKNDIYDPPQTWERFQEDVIKIVQVDAKNKIVQPAAALGTTANLVRPTDILAALMLQTGVEMIDEEAKYATFHQSIRKEDNYNAGLEALRFYTDFADISKKVYTWNQDQESALGLFRQGKLAYFFGYSYNLSDIRGSKVNFGVAPLPVPQGAVSNISVANYWVETVSKKSAQPEQAWHFLNFLSQAENLLDLQNTTGRISPLRIQSKEIEDSELSVFALQSPQALVWYHGQKAPVAEGAMMEMIDSVVDGTRSLEEALSFGAQQVTQSLR